MEKYETTRIKSRVDNLVTRLDAQIFKKYVDPSSSLDLIIDSAHVIDVLVNYIRSLEVKLESTIESNQMLAQHAENLIAENQRLNQIAKY